jgi:hypothetical protein
MMMMSVGGGSREVCSKGGYNTSMLKDPGNHQRSMSMKRAHQRARHPATK